MSRLNNPAGRLHELLLAYQAAADQNKSINRTWAEVLGVTQRDLMPRLGQVAGLLDEVRTAVERADRIELKANYDQFASRWAYPLFGHGRNPVESPSPGADLIDQEALVALGTLATVFELIAPDGRVPSEEQQEELRVELRDLLTSLTDDPTLPPNLRAAIVARVHDILWAIDHVRIVGPDGVQAAVERLVGQLFIFTTGNEPARASNFFSRAMALAARAWSVFRVGEQAAGAVEGWETIFQQLPPGS